MFSLVADYGTSDEEEALSSDTNDTDDESNPKEKTLDNSIPRNSTLPSASIMLANEKKTIPGGVFSNPFKEAEDAKIASLEKHVKMVDPEHEISEQKRKICWSYRKGRCRFGSKCNFAHDSDLIQKKDLQGANEDSEESAYAQCSSGGVSGATQEVCKPRNKKKRPGLSRELVPPKKVLKMYQREKYSGKP